MNVGVDASCSNDLPLAGNDLGARPDDDSDVVLNVWVSSFPHANDTALLNADVCFNDAPMIDDQRIGNDGVNGLSGT